MISPEASGFWTVLLFVLFTVIYAVCWIFFFDETRRTVRHSVLSMSLGTILMGSFAAMINGLSFLGLGETALWVVVLVPFLMFTMQDHGAEKMTAIWLLPIWLPKCARAHLHGRA